MSQLDGTPVSRGHRVPEAPVVSACIPVVSGNGLIEGCLDSLAASNPSVETEVVVVANGLTDEGYQLLRKRNDIVLVRSAVNAGFSGGNNLASRLTRGHYLLLLNDDSLVEEGYIDRLLTTLKRDRSIAAVGGKINSPDGTLQEAGSVLWSDGWAAHVGAGLPAGSNKYNYVRYTDYISANGLLVDRRAWDTVGGFDERFFPAYYEDVDLCLALWHHGYRVAYEPRARLTHLESQSTSNYFKDFLIVRNRAELVAKWSTKLHAWAEHPDPIDDAAIDAAVIRAQCSLGRVLVVETLASSAEWRLSHTIESLVKEGWSVMVSAPACPGSVRAADRVVRERMVDLGVDVRDQRPDDLLSSYGDRMEAVVASEDMTAELHLRRRDGSSIPFLVHREDLDVSVVRGVADVARGRGSSPLSAAQYPPERVGEAGGRPDGGPHPLVGTPDDAPGPSVSPVPDDAARRDRKFAEANARILVEYCSYLERELSRFDADFRGLVEAFDQRERYIDSLFSVRVKKWLLSRLRRSNP